MYIIYQCGGVSTGHFANNPSGPRTLTLSTTGACVQTTSATYTGAIPNTDGATALYDEFGNVSYVINGCNAPVVTVNPFWSFTNAICNNYGDVNLNNLLSSNATTGGTWSGVGVIGSTFNPIGIIGTTSITYSVSPSGNCTETSDSTIVFSVDTTPIVTQLLQSCDVFRIRRDFACHRPEFLRNIIRCSRWNGQTKPCAEIEFLVSRFGQTRYIRH
jgi:hypothetical protein